jgi:hypothetical protein
MAENGDALKARKHAHMRIAGGYFGLLVFGVCVYIALRNGEHSVVGALTNRSVQIFTFPSMLAAFSVASAIQFRAHLGFAARVAAFVPAILLVGLGAWSWGGA